MKIISVNEYGEQVVTMKRSDRGPLTDEEEQMIANLEGFEDKYDEDCPPMSEEMIEQMRKDIEVRKEQNRLAAMG